MSEGSRFVRGYVRVLAYCKWPTLALWLVLVGLCAWLAPGAISRTTSAFLPPAGSLAAQGDDAVEAAFGQGVGSPFALYLHGDRGMVESEAFERFSMALNASLWALPGPSSCGGSCVVAFQGYWLLRQLGLPAQSYSSLASADGTASIFQLAVSLRFSDPAAIAFAQAVEVAVEAARVQHVPNTTATLLGVPAFIPILLHDVELNLGLMDAITIPLALALFAVITKSVRLLVLPITSIVCSICTSFATITLLSYATPVMSYVPSLVMSILVATSFDYALFVSVRFREELLRHPGGPVDASALVVATLQSAGHTIAVSGSILALSFVCSAFLPLRFVAVTGIASALSIVESLLVNLSLVPALLLVFPSFFARAVEPFSCCGRSVKWGARPSVAYTPLVREPAACEGEDVAAMQASNWYRLGTLNVRPRSALLMIALVIAVCVPLAAFSWQYVASDALVQDLPRGSRLLQGYTNFTRDFGLGFSMPTQLLLYDTTGASCTSQHFFVQADAIVRNIARATNTSASSWAGAVVNSQLGPSLWHGLWTACQVAPTSTSVCRAVALADSLFLNGTRTATLLVYTSRDDPLAPSGNQWLARARAALANATAGTTLKGFFVGIPVDSWDSINAVNQWFPVVIGLSASVVLLLIGFVFGSSEGRVGFAPLVALRSVVSLALSCGFVFGLATLVYDDPGLLSWLHYAGLSNTGGLTFLVPIICFSVVCGISVDFDVFLLTRVAELRSQGLSTRDAIRAAQWYTGPVITTAGAIQAVAFCGLLLSSTTSLNQMGFILATSVLFDALLMRTLMVPSVMALLGEVNWWPTRRASLPVTRALPEPLPGCCARRKHSASASKLRLINDDASSSAEQ